MVLGKNKFNSFVAATLCSVMILSPAISAIAADMPTGGSVQSGNVKIAAIDLKIDRLKEFRSFLLN